jgi:hypothetical protein
MNQDSPSNKQVHNDSQGNIVPLSSRPLTKTDILLEELNVVKLEGRYFCFDRKALAKRKGALTYRDGQRGLIIKVSDEFGHPSILAYRVLQAIFRKVTLEGKPYPDVVSFSYRELGRLVGREVFGGKDSKELYRAIGQLEDTKIILFLYDNAGKEFRRVSLKMVIGTGFIGEGDVASPSRIKAAMVRLDPIIIDSMRKEHFAIFDWAKIESLEPLAAAFFKRLYVHFSNLYENQYDRSGLRFEKDYADICGEWLGGLEPEVYKSRIHKQLGEHLEALRRVGLIRSAAIEKRADGQGFKLAFRPGEGFFRDYALFYVGRRAPVLQFQQASDKHHIQGPIEGAAYFYSRLHNVAPKAGQIYSKRDADFARSLIGRLGEAGFHELVDFAVAEASKTNFQMKNIRALDVYLPHWQATLAEREQAVARRRVELNKQADERLKEDYEAFRKHELFDRLAKLDAAEQEEIRRLASERFGGGPVANDHVRERILSAYQQQILAERYPVQSFEEWKKTHA